jgi:hypothetical protein
MSARTNECYASPSHCCGGRHVRGRGEGSQHPDERSEERGWQADRIPRGRALDKALECADSFSMQWTTYPIRYFLIAKQSGP